MEIKLDVQSAAWLKKAIHALLKLEHSLSVLKFVETVLEVLVRYAITERSLDA